MKEIISLDNKIIKESSLLKNSKNRKEKQEFLIDGARELELALIGGYLPYIVFYCSEIDGEKNNKLLINLKKKNVEIIKVSKKVLKKLAYKENPDGFVSVVKNKKNNLELLKNKNQNQNIIVLEGLEKPGNLGAIIRTAVAAGIKNIILNDCVIDIYNPNAIKASEGLIFFVNIFNQDKKETLNYLQKNNISSIGAITKAKENYKEVKTNDRVAIILGSESHGLSDFWINNIDKAVRIPMAKEVDSLNVSVSTAILVYEFAARNKFLGLK